MIYIPVTHLYTGLACNDIPVTHLYTGLAFNDIYSCNTPVHKISHSSQIVKWSRQVTTRRLALCKSGLACNDTPVTHLYTGLACNDTPVTHLYTGLACNYIPVTHLYTRSHTPAKSPSGVDR